MTEKEATKKWCPMARQLAGEEINLAAATNRGYGRTEECNCIASECMAWRWSTVDDDGSGKFALHGYCGLAGRQA